ncbi:hypothetical protein L798_06657, partial [Zootermopsis nevadensis]
ETWTLRKKERKYLESFEMWCWRRIEKIRWTDRVTNEEVLRRVNEQRSILQAITRRKANWLGHIMRRNGLLSDITEGQVEGKRGLGRKTWTLRKKERKYLESFEMWCWRRIEKIRWTDRVTNEEVLRRVNEQRSILQAITRRKANWLGHIMRRNGLLSDIIEGQVEGKRGLGR